MAAIRSLCARLLFLCFDRLFRRRNRAIIFLISCLWLVLFCISLNLFIQTDTRTVPDSFLTIKDTIPPPPELPPEVDLNLSLVENLVQIYLTRHNQLQDPYRLKSEESYLQFLRRLAPIRTEGPKLFQDNATSGETSLGAFQRGISQHYMYDPFSQDLSRLLTDLSTLPIVSAVKVPEGSQLKILLTLSDGSQGRFKPMRRPKEETINPNVLSFHGYERHTSEIAAFYLDRVLGFYRAAPTFGRVLNITSDLANFTSTKNWVEYVYRSPADNVCFVANCADLCGATYPYCGQGDLLEGSISAMLPLGHIHGRRMWSHNPYSPVNTYKGKPKWTDLEDFCETDVKNSTRFRGSRALLDLMDIVIFDFFTGNLDRHTVEWFKDSGNNSFLFHVDNGRGFGSLKNDVSVALTPLKQCCLIRLSTLAKLIKIYMGPIRLSDLMRTSLNSDPASPVLSEPHLAALDERLAQVLQAVESCFSGRARSWGDVVLDDGVI